MLQFFLQKDTQPSQACSESCNFLLGFKTMKGPGFDSLVKSTQYRGALSQLHNALAAVQLFNSVVRGL
jgi:hypothetical protein